MSNSVLIEIGLEELPARFIDDAEKQLKEKTISWLKESRLNYSDVQSFSTPRRLAVLISEIADMQTTVEEEVRGPAMNIAKDGEGEWTKAAIGFARGQGKSVEDLVEKEIKGKSYVFVTKRIEGKATKELLLQFKQIIETIQYPQNMRWGTESLRYARPIRWIAALYGEEIVPIEIAGVKADKVTYGHRNLGSKITINNPADYEETLKSNYVIADPAKRKEAILFGIKRLEEVNDFKVPIDKDLLDEVSNLVEYPTVFIGSFEEKYLKLPQEVLIISMKEHQRYFPVKSFYGELLPCFVGVRNGNDEGLETVIKGNEKVLRARLQDAEFFFEEDQKNSIDFYLEKLERVVFQEKLGTLSDKIDRVKYIAAKIADKLQLDEEVKQYAVRAAEICKFDLPTNMVDEFPELEGVIGEIYANNFNEHKLVAQAVREHYLPKHSNGALPETIAGAVLSVADKIDTIGGIISVGLLPTGSQDPHGLRRQAAGILRILEEMDWHITLEEIIEIAKTYYQGLDIEKIADAGEKIHEFFQLRASFLLREHGVEQDIIQAVIAEEIGNFNDAVAKAKLLSAKRQDETFKEKEEALVRVLNLADKAGDVEVQPEHFETDSEKELYEQFKQAKEQFKAANEERKVEDAFEQLESLANPIHSFFEHNMVMADDEKIRHNRLALVKEISQLIKQFADLSLIEWKQHF